MSSCAWFQEYGADPTPYVVNALRTVGGTHKNAHVQGSDTRDTVEVA